MDPNQAAALIQTGGVAALAFAAVGSALGSGAAGASAVGAWKKCYVQKKPAPFLLAAFVGAPLSQTIYGFVLMLVMNFKVNEIMQAVQAQAGNGTPIPLDITQLVARWPFFLVGGFVGGIAMGASAWMQGRAGAGASDAFAETGEGFTNNLTVLGIIETVALFVMVFTLIYCL